jgi:hypothetical protein
MAQVGPTISPTVDQDISPTVDQVISPTIDQVISPTIDQVIDPTIDQVIDPTIDQDISPTVNQVISPTVDQDDNKGSDSATKPKLKPCQTAYWGIQLDNKIFEHEEVQLRLNAYLTLCPLKDIHSTLLYVGKRSSEKEQTFIDLEHNVCKLVIDGIGVNSKAMALSVKSIKMLSSETDVPTYAEKQHITLALDEHTQPRHSVLTLNDKSTFTLLANEIEIYGKIRRYI